jgi:hypothetical protein
MRFRRHARRALIVATGLVVAALTLASNLLFGGDRLELHCLFRAEQPSFRGRHRLDAFRAQFHGAGSGDMFNVGIVHFGFLRRLAGRHVQHEAFLFILRALPMAVAACAAALILMAAA